MIQIYQFHNSEMRTISLEEFGQKRARNEGIFWMDLESPETGEEREILENLLRLPVDVLESARAGRGREVLLPSLEDHAELLYVRGNAVTVLDRSEKMGSKHERQFVKTQLNIFLFSQLLVTHHYVPVASIAYTLQMCTRDPSLGVKGPGYLSYLIVDSLVDGLPAVLGRIGVLIEEYEDRILIDRDEKSINRSLSLRKDVISVQRMTYYQREVLHRLAHGELAQISAAEKVKFLSTYEHITRLTEVTKAFRDGIGGLMDAYLSLTSESTNRVMKFLTITSTIFLPLNIITGFYGMNLAFLPGAASPYSYIPVILSMVVIAGVMIFAFRLQKWL